MDEKLKALANDIMKQCQEQGLTCDEVDRVAIMIRAHVADNKLHAVEGLKFKAESV